MGIKVPVNKAKSQRVKSAGRLAGILVAPTLLLITVVIVWPSLAAVWSSLFGTPGLDPETGFVNDTAPFVGMQNYADIFNPGNTRFWIALGNTTLFGFVTVIIETVIGLGMALIMHRAMRGRGLVRAAILVPWAVPTAVSAILWKWIFDPHGAANALFGTDILWSAGNWSAKWAVMIADIWKTSPFIGLLALAGLQVISSEVYEAAKLDGAGPIRRFFSITLPLAKPAIVVAVLFRILDALRMFDLPYILIGARKGSVETLSMLVQDEASNLRYGSAAANAIILFLYVFIIAISFVKIFDAEIISGSEHKSPTKLRLFRRNSHKGAVK